MIVREAEPQDVPELLELMKALARFENYIDDFAVTEAAILRNGFGPDALFKAFVAQGKNLLIGMAITYPVLWTYTLKPKLVLKELFICDNARGEGVGRALIAQVKNHAIRIGADEISWTVMAGNEKAEAFYRQMGGQPDSKWLNWVLEIP